MKRVIVGSVLLGSCVGVFAEPAVKQTEEEREIARQKKEDVMNTKAGQSRVKVFKSSGPVVGTVLAGKKPEYDVMRGYVVDLGDDAGVVFNADTLQFSGGWLSGGGVHFHGLPFDTGHGATPQWDEGKALFKAKNSPGWASAEGKFDDPRTGEGVPKLGGLPEKWGKFKGYYVNGEDVVFSYSVGEADVLDCVRKAEIDGESYLVRQIDISKVYKERLIFICDIDGVAKVTLEGDGFEKLSFGKTTIYTAGDSEQKFVVRDGKAFVRSKGGILFLTFGGNNLDWMKLARSYDILDFKKVVQGGEKRFGTREPIVTKGVIGKGDGSYVVDKVALPNKNPFGKSLRVGAFDFFSDGKSLALSTWDGDVWKVSGLEGNFDTLTWQLVATGLHESLGLEIVDDVIYTLGNDQITKHVDLNGDGETDFYTCFNNSWPLSKGFHIFSFDLKADAKGDFWFVHGAPVRGGGRGFERMGSMNGSILRVSKDGSEVEQFASGFRAANGMGVGPNGEITVGDNEGTFVPRCPIHWVTKGYFGGVVDTYAKKGELKTDIWSEKGGKVDVSEMPKPLAWLPREVDNSGGGQVWVEGDKWGMPAGTMLHLSYGQSALYSVFKDEVNGQVQGGVQQIPVRLTSSAMRGRFSPADGQLYVGGLKGWQTNAAELGGIDRVRFTGEVERRVTSLEAVKGGVKLGFNFELDDELAEDVESYALQAANIKWSHQYGSKEFLLDGKGEGWTKLKVTGAKLLEGGKAVMLSVEGMRPAHEFKLDLDLESKDGDEVIFPVWFTVHSLRE